MWLRIILRKLGLSSEPSQRDLLEGIRDRIGVYEEKQHEQHVAETSSGPMIILHRLNQKEITINTGQVQSIEKMGDNALIVFSSGNRIIVLESAETIHKLITEQIKEKER